ncbi:thrombospondin type 3 repeat-containing protein [Reinekea sp. G2M2-21]|uniref:thrombospondin type 3 repeat-containing protein n=1 Tax=Reinekea sp. G2M2-21 TaxID=2788942 RepID=UPI0018A8F152|nr:thrombospondin type 3 repeat-containing protein [Reinekea sp. G2M2-21]
MNSRKLVTAAFSIFGIGVVHAAPTINNVTSIESAVTEPSSYHSRLYSPLNIYGMNTDQNGDLFFSDSSKNKVFKVNRSMRVTLNAGNGGNTNLSSTPQGIAKPYLADIDGSDWFIIENSLWVYSDILKRDKVTNRWALAHDGQSSYGALFQTVDFLADDGALFYTNTYSTYNYKVNKWDAQTGLQTALGGGTEVVPTDGTTVSSENIRFSSSVLGLAKGSSGTIFLSSNNRIYAWNRSDDTIKHIYGNGGNTIVPGSDPFQSGGTGLTDIEYDADANTLYFIEEYQDLIGALNLTDGTVSIVVGGGADTGVDAKSPLAVKFSNINDLEIGPNGELFIQDNNKIIYVVTEDTDSDGANDWVDQWPADASRQYDYDFDGIDNNIDTDSDNDGVSDVDEETAGTSKYAADSDGDGYNDSMDAFPLDPTESLDSDGDGVGDNTDRFPYDATESEDVDGDGIGNNSDLDNDNDGVIDINDAFPLDPSEQSDSDGDGVGDNVDAFPFDAAETTDADNDGVGANVDVNDFDSSVTIDSDGDGYADEVDAFINDATEYQDSDGDGVGDVADLDDDNDLEPDSSDAFPFDPSEQADMDNDGFGDNKDVDSNSATRFLDVNNNGIADADELKMTSLVGPILPAQLQLFGEDSLVLATDNTLMVFDQDYGVFYRLDESTEQWLEFKIFETDPLLTNRGVDANDIEAVSLAPNNVVYFSDDVDNIYKWVVGGAVEPLISGFDNPFDLAPFGPEFEEGVSDVFASSIGDLYVVYRDDDVIYQLDVSAQTYTRIIGDGNAADVTEPANDVYDTADGVNARTAKLNLNQVAATAAGQVFFTDSNGGSGDAIRTVDSNGNLQTVIHDGDLNVHTFVAEDGPAAQYSLAWTTDLQVGNNRLFVLEDFDDSTQILELSEDRLSLRVVVGAQTYDNEDRLSLRAVVGAQRNDNENQVKLGRPARSSYAHIETAIGYYKNQIHFLFWDAFTDASPTLGTVTQDGYLSALNNWTAYEVGNSGASYWSNLVLDNNGKIYVTNGSRVFAWENGGWNLKVGGGNQSVINDGVAPLDASIGSIQHGGIAFDSQNRLIIGDSNRYVFYRLELDGQLYRIAGTYNSFGNVDAVDARNGRVGRYLRYLTTDSNDQIVYFDDYYDTIRRINADGSLSTIAGKGSNTPSSIYGQPSELVRSLTVNALSFLEDGRLVVSANYDFNILPNGNVEPPFFSQTVNSVFERDGRVYISNGGLSVRNDKGQFVSLHYNPASSGDADIVAFSSINKAVASGNTVYLLVNGQVMVADFDVDNDGWVAALDLDDNSASIIGDFDGDGVANNIDPDIDGDGVLNGVDLLSFSANISIDTDGDGIPDAIDADDDNDRLYDEDDLAPLIKDMVLDSDGDGYADIVDAFPFDATEHEDSDGDGIGNIADNDDDNDGVLDINDIAPLNPSVSTLKTDSGKKGGSLSTSGMLLLLFLLMLRRKKRFGLI